MRKIVLGIFFSLIAICSFAKGSSDKDSPIQSFKIRHNLYEGFYITFEDGREVDYESVEDVWPEKEAWAYIEGYGKLHFWLYDMYSKSGGAGRILINEVIPEWVEEKGYIIDYEHAGALSGLDAVPLSVKRLMDQRHSHLAVALITSDAPYPNIPLEYQSQYKHPYLLVYWDDKKDDKFYTFVYPLY